MEINSVNLTFVIHGGVWRKPLSGEIGVTESNYISDLPLIIFYLTNFFNNPKIIVSTWYGVIIPKECFIATNNIEVVYSKDPGPSTISVTGRTHNLDRHMISTNQGLKNVKTEFSLVMRDDLYITSDKIIKKYNTQKKLQNDFHKQLKGPILALADGTKIEKNAKFYKLISRLFFFNTFPFHTCDFLYLGHTTDLRKLFPSNKPFSDGRIHDDKLILSMLSNKKLLLDRNKLVSKKFIYVQKFITETFPIAMFLNRYDKLNITSSWDWSTKNFNESFKWHTKSCILISMSLNNIRWAKQNLPGGRDKFHGRYTEFLWKYYNSKNIIKKTYFLIMHFLYKPFIFLFGFLFRRF